MPVVDGAQRGRRGHEEMGWDDGVGDDLFGRLYIRAPPRPDKGVTRTITTMREVILSASAPISIPQSGSILFHDILNGSSLASFKQSSSSKNCTAIINSTGAQGGLILAVQPDKSLLNVYSFQKVLLHIQDPTSMTFLTFPVLRIKFPSRSSSPNDYLALP